MNEPGTMCTIGRRGFVERSVGALLCAPGVIPMLSASVTAMLAGCASLVTRTVTPVNGTLRLALAHYPELTESEGSLKVVPDGAAEAIYVLALGEGQYAALSPICTHLGCTVEIQDTRLVCPCHGSTYDRQGRVQQGPAERALARYRSELTADGVLVIELGARS
jgi:Rieske Fe-S protein